MKYSDSIDPVPSTPNKLLVALAILVLGFAGGASANSALNAQKQIGAQRDF